MKRIVAFFIAVVAVAALAAFVTMRWSKNHTTTDAVAAHDWLHKELQLTDAQHKALEPVELKFAESQRRLAAALHQANMELARAIKEDKAYTPRGAAAVEHVHHCMGDLQKTSIEHVFAMRAVLSPEQGEKLLSLAQRALEQSP
jgi:nickel and cobalt resistance protein CnrR